MTHSQMRSAPDPLDDAGVLVTGAVGVGVMVVKTVDGPTVGVTDGGADVAGGAVAVAGALSVGESRTIAPLAACAHAVARHPVTRMAAAGSTLLIRRRIQLLPRF